MRVIYNKERVPYLMTDNMEIIEISSNNKTEVIPFLSTNPEILQEIKDSIVENFRENYTELSSLSAENFQDLQHVFTKVVKGFNLGDIINVCFEAEDLYYQLTTPKPHPPWYWNSNLRDWLPPAPPPKGEINEIYMWSDFHGGWYPIEPSPYPSWNWSFAEHRWIAPIAYPQDAPQGAFVWNEDTQSWIINA